jgi:hypothetical protein
MNDIPSGPIDPNKPAGASLLTPPELAEGEKPGLAEEESEGKKD